MIAKTIGDLMERELKKLMEEIKQYKSGEALWKIAGEIKNPGGNLCLHVCGNLQHFIGTVLGNTGYVRNRDMEFTAKNIPASTLISEIEQTIKVVTTTLSKIKDDEIEKEYTAFPAHLFGLERISLGYFLFHLLSHLDYHIGQVNYHRRLIT
jgi:hypothetical protein